MRLPRLTPFGRRTASSPAAALVVAEERDQGCDRDLIAASGLFDPSFYLRTSPDVAAAGLDPLDHFRKDGWREGRRPNLYFDPAWYAATQPGTSPDENPLLHYIREGEAAGCRPVEAFDPTWFRSVAEVSPGASPLATLLAHREAQGIAPDALSDLNFWDDRFVIASSGLFDLNFYLIASPDVREAGRDPIYHFHAHGWREGRQPNPYFDPRWYAARYLGDQPGEDPLSHYVRHGEAKGFHPSCLFDPAWYRSAYEVPADRLALAHFLEHRRSQKVAPNPHFDPAFYLARHGAEIGPGRDPFMHLLRWGATRDLDPSGVFDSAAYRRQEMAAEHPTQVPLVHFLEHAMCGPAEEARNNRQSICLCMIVKDEAPVIRRCLDSVRPLIDAWLIVDTGSSDETRAIVHAALAGLPGALHERPWRDFAHNRSEALDLARPHAGYCLIIDADDELIMPPGFVLPELTEDAYVLGITDAGIAYGRTQLVSNRLPWRYEGVLHEYLVCEAARPAGHLPIVMRRNHDGARRRDPATYRNDAAVLERALGEETDPFKRARYTFYLAQSYRDCGEAAKAVECYLARVEMGFWEEEVFVSLLGAGRLMEALGRPRSDILATYARATTTCPARIEAAHAAGRLCRLADEFAAGYAATIKALGRPMPSGGLFLEPWIYAYGLADEVSVNAYWSGHYREAADASLLALESPALPGDERPRLLRNLRFALDRLTVADDASTPATAKRTPGGWAPATPKGGTELMVDAVRERLGDALAPIDLRINLYDPATRDGRPLVVWFHHDIDQAAVQWCRDGMRVAPVDAFVFISHWQRERFMAAFGLAPERCVVIRYAMEQGADVRRWEPAPVLRCAYTSTPFRGLDVLLDAWDMLALPSAELHIWSSMKLYVADDEPYRHLFERARTMPGVTYHGLAPNPELRAALRTMHFLTYPSTFAETACLSVMEAMAAGCRVIAPAYGALPETTGGYARLYPSCADHRQHVATFAETLADELASPWRGRPECALAQQTHCLNVFAWSRCLDEWRELIARVAGRHDARPASGNTAAAAPHPVDRLGDTLKGLRAQGFDPGAVLDVGAHDGAFARAARQVFPAAHILMIDALEEKEAILRDVATAIGDASHHIALLGDREGAPTPFFVVDTQSRPDLVTTGSSMFRENTAFPMKTRVIEQRTLSSLLGERTFTLVKLDVQGAELDVLRGLGARLDDVEVILVELSLVAYNEGAPLLAAVVRDLGAMGFLLYDLADANRYPDGRLLQVDGVFVRTDASFRPRPPFWS